MVNEAAAVPGDLQYLSLCWNCILTVILLKIHLTANVLHGWQCPDEIRCPL